VTKPVFVNTKPVAAFANDTVCAGSQTHFTDLSAGGSGTITGWDWDFGDGSAHSNQQNPAHLFAAPGIYVVKLTITDTYGCMNDTAMPVRVWELPYAAFTASTQNCAGTAVQFFSQSASAQGLIVQYLWDFGDGGTFTVTSPASPDVTHVYLTPANYSVTLTVTNSNGCSAQVIHTVIVSPNPVANFSFPASGNCMQSSVQFTNLSQPNGGGTITAWEWNFGDPLSGGNNTSALQNPSHFYAFAGWFDVTLIIHSINGCSDTVSKPLTINALPTALFASDTACLGSPTSFTNLSVANSGSLASYDWDFGDGSPHSNNANPVHLYASAGSFNVTLTVTNTMGCTNDTTLQVLVSQNPLAIFTFPNQNCALTPVIFDDQSATPQGYITQWQWNFGDGISVVVDFPDPPDVSHSYSSAGTFNVSLTVVSSMGCEATVSHSVTITPAPVANFQAGNATCQNIAVQFTDLTQLNGGGPLVTWNWNFGDPSSGINNLSSLQNPMHVFDTAGIYNVTLIVSNTGTCADTITKQVLIGDAPIASFSADSACFSSPTHFSDSSIANAASIVSWLWLFGDGGSSTLQNPVHTYANWGNYTVTLQVVNSANCISDTSVIVFVKPLPTAIFSFDGACAGAPTQFNDISATASGSIVSWLWDFGDGTTDTVQHPIHVYAQGGSFNVSLTVTNSFGCTASIAQTVTIFNSPSASFTSYSVFCPAGQVSFQDLSSGNGSPIAQRSWNFGDGFYSSAANPVYTYSYPDSCYTVSLIVTNAHGCADTIADTVCVKPAFAFTLSSIPGCAGTATSFSPVNLAQGDSLMFVQWSFGDPASGPYNFSNKYLPTHIYNTPGTYFVKLRAWNTDNCLDSTYAEVHILDAPVANFSWPVSPACDSVVTFTNSSNVAGAAIDSLYWNFGDGSDTTLFAPLPPMIAHKFPAYGFFDVSLTAFVANGCSGSISKQVKVKCLSSYFTAMDTVCQFQPVVFSDSSAPAAAITSWLWLFGDGSYNQYFTYQPDITHIYDTAGIFPVQLTTTAVVNGLSVQDVYTRYIYVRPAPVINFSADKLCQGLPVQFSDLSLASDDSIVSWKWSFGDGKSSVLPDPLHTFKGDTVFNVSLLVNTLAGCSASDTATISLNPLPVVFLSPSSGLFCNTAEPVVLQDTSFIPYPFYTWVWGDGDTLFNALAQESHFFDIGSYEVILTATAASGCPGSDTAAIRMKPGPAADFDIDKIRIPVTNPTVYLSDRSFSPDSPVILWNWYINDSISAGHNQSLVYSFADTARYSYVPDTGSYKVTLFVQNVEGCSDTVSHFVTIYGDEQFNAPNAFSPNGDGTNDDFIPYSMYYQPTGYLFQIYNRWGMLIFETNNPAIPWDGTYKDGDAPVGVYVWTVTLINQNNRTEIKNGNVLLIR
jgi:gliding motility-associated-like protein